MLCATNQVNAQDASHHSHPSSHSSTATDSTLSPHIMLMHDPYDPRINDEYEALVRKWTDHLLSKSRHSPINSTISSTTTPPSPHHLTKNNKIIDRLLEEQWIDAQRVLSCAQAWNTRDSLSIEEAVRTMNILGLRMMQRSLTTRHELNVQHQQCPAKTDEPDFDMPSFDLQSKTLLDEAITIPRFSLALSLDEDDEHEMHAPLLRRYQQSSDDSSSDNTSNHHPITSNNNVQAANSYSTTTSTLSTPARRPFRLMQSPSAPDFSESALLMERENCANKFAPASNYYRYYPMSWRPLPEHEDDDANDVDAEDNNRHISISSSSTSSSSTTSSDQDHEGYAWKSWFNHSHHQADNQHKQHICTFCWNPIAKKSLSTGDADDAAASRLLSSSHSSSLESTTTGVGASGQAQVWSPDSYHSACSPDKALLDDKYGCSNDESSSMEEDVFETPTTSSFGFQTDTILRSESSISAFRPISKNLAPRCSPPSSSSTPPDNWRYRRRETSSSMQADLPPQQQQRPAIPKSQSFPSKVASLASSSSNSKVPDVPIIKASTTKSSASATTVPATIMGKSVDKGTSSSSSKERNFVMRSIVSKKASLSKLFSGSKKQ